MLVECVEMALIHRVNERAKDNALLSSKLYISCDTGQFNPPPPSRTPNFTTTHTRPLPLRS